MHLALSLITNIITCLLLQQVAPSNAKDFRGTRLSADDERLLIATSDHIPSPSPPPSAYVDFQAPVVLWTGAKIPSNETIFQQLPPPSQLRLGEGVEPFSRRSRLKDKPSHRNRHKTKSGLLIESNTAAEIYLTNITGKDRSDSDGVEGETKQQLPLPLFFPLTNVSVKATARSFSPGKRNNGEGRKRKRVEHNQQRKRKRKGRNGGGTVNDEAGPNKMPNADGQNAGRQRHKLQRNGNVSHLMKIKMNN